MTEMFTMRVYQIFFDIFIDINGRAITFSLNLRLTLTNSGPHSSPVSFTLL